MQSETMPDIITNDIAKLNTDLLDILLFDRTSRKNIIWGTNDYEDLGSSFNADKEITIDLITGKNEKVIQPRVLKASKQKEGRTRERAEVFTPSWICNRQNNLIDEQWFGRKNVFNISEGTAWEAMEEAVSFAEKGSKTWKKYIDAKRLEITCGEAPYLVSRYDTVTGRPIPIKERIGLLDRKLRVAGENTEGKEAWMKWARRAIESVYGYEFQGDNLLVARWNILSTFIEYYRERFGGEPDHKCLKGIALVISWNLWQMDGFNCAIPFCESGEEPHQITLSEYYSDLGIFDYSILSDTKGQALCKIRDWRMKETVLYKSIVGGDRG